jgi:hypothetical protein
MAVACVLCKSLCPENSDFDICPGCRAGICASTRTMSEKELEARGNQLDLWKSRNIEARNHAPNSYLEQLLTKRKLRKQQDTQHGKGRNRHRATRARA